MRLLCIGILITNVCLAQDLTKECVWEYIVQSGIENPEIVMRQAIHETGHFESYSCRARNNLFGATNGRGDYLWFDSWEESIDWYKRWQCKHYDGTRNYYKFLDCLWKGNNGECARYAEDPLYTQKLKKIKL